MGSPNYSAFTQGSGGAAPAFVDLSTQLNAVNLNHLANDPAAYAEAHIQGTANNHGSVDILDYSAGAATTLTEAATYTNTTGGGDIVISGTHYYSQYMRNDQAFSILKTIIGGTGTLSTRVSTLGTGAKDLTTITSVLFGGSPSFSAVTVSNSIVSIAPNSNTVAIQAKNDAANEDGYLFLVTDNAGSGIYFSVQRDLSHISNAVTLASTLGVTGNTTLSGTLAVTGTSTLTGAVTFTSAPVFNIGTTMSSVIGDYKASTNVSAATISIAAGPAFLDSEGNWLGPYSARTVTLPTQPTGTNIQYVWVSMAPSTGTLTATGGTVGTAPPIPTFPTGNEPIALVTWRGAGSLPSGVVAAADIVDARFWGHTIGAVNGITSASTLWTVGAPSSSGDTSGIQGTTILKGTASGTVNGETFTPLNSSGSNATSATVGVYAIGSGDVADEGGGTADTNLGLLISNRIGASLENAPQSQWTATTNTLQLNTAQSMLINGHMKYNGSASNTLTFTGLNSGVYDIFADSTDNGGVSGNGFKIVKTARASAFSATQATAGSNQRWIGAWVWDSTTSALYNVFPDLSVAAITSSSQHRLQIQRTSTAGVSNQTISSASLVAVSATNTYIDIFIAHAMDFILDGMVNVVTVSSAPLYAIVQFAYSGSDPGTNSYALGTSNFTSNLVSNATGRYIPVNFAGSQFDTIPVKGYLSLGAPGRYRIGFVASASTGSWVFGNCYMQILPTIT